MSRLIDADLLGLTDMEIIMCDGSYKEALKMLIDKIDNAPIVEPERKTGRWVPAFNGKFTGGAYWFNCSECGRIVPEVRNGGWNYCPNCGADMREGAKQE